MSSPDVPASWTTRVRDHLTNLVPPGQALPDRQPVYVASWMYLFGVLAMTSLLVVIGSGVVLAIGGATWWHTSGLGHFTNSVHLWSVELFFMTMVIHLWGQFWMAAWRGGRALTWATGVIAFVTSIGTAFTGYLSQSDFQSQWIAGQAKDGLNSIGVGAWFNVLNPGQMLLWHVTLLPVAIGLIVVIHVVMVRRKGVVPPLGVEDPAVPRRRRTPDSLSFPVRSYDLVKEFVAALTVVALLSLGLAAVFSSPDDAPITLRGWAQADPADVVATAASELAGTSASATYGPPYNHASSGQTAYGLPLQSWGGVRIPVDSAALVTDPLRMSTEAPGLAGALQQWDAAGSGRQQAWAAAYVDALAKAPGGDPAKVPAGSYGPVPTLTARFLDLARAGGLEGALASSGSFYGGDQTRTLLLLTDGAYLEDQARALQLGGDQWGMMNESGNYPGQPWMWLYTFWYQVKPFSTSENADAQVWLLMMVLTAGLVLVPLIPGLRDVPRLVPVHRLIWRSYYRKYGEAP